MTAIRNMIWGVVLGSVALAAGCELDVSLGSDERFERRNVLDVPAERKDNLDLLFVVDNSSDMEQRQLELTTSFDHLISAVTGVDGELPNLHVGVISTDLGADQYASAQTSCTAAGDAAQMLAEPLHPGCDEVDGSYLLRLKAGGEVLENYRQPLAQSFDCIARLGSGGCDYEQPLAAMRRALDGSVAGNLGFVRENSVLGVIFLTDEDDCSARVPELFDPDNPDLPSADDPGWRCFTSGVTCTGVDDVFPPGWQMGCEARADSPYVANVDDYISFLRQLKSDPNHLVVSGIIGDPNLVNIEVEIDDRLSLAPACTDGNGVVYPGVRMSHFFDGFGAGTEYEALCRGDRPMGILGGIADQLRNALGSTCLRGPLYDLDPATAGIQVDCEVNHQWADGTLELIQECGDRFNPTSSGSFPCYTILPGNDACSHEPTRLALRVYYSADYDPDDRRYQTPDLPGVRLQANCLTAELF
jgi:hypothetical protein